MQHAGATSGGGVGRPDTGAKWGAFLESSKRWHQALKRTAAMGVRALAVAFFSIYNRLVSCPDDKSDPSIPIEVPFETARAWGSYSVAH